MESWAVVKANRLQFHQSINIHESEIFEQKIKANWNIHEESRSIQNNGVGSLEINK